MRRSFVSLVLFGAVGSHGALADEPKPVPTHVTLTHVAPDRWRADYTFAEPVTQLTMERTGTAYRKEAWHVSTPGVAIQPNPEGDVITAAKPLKTLSVDIGYYPAYSHSAYTPMDRFTDGGTDFYLGYLRGQVNGARPMELKLELQGLPGENVITPPTGPDLPDMYAYFGPASPVPAGVASLVLDPNAPAWVKEVLDATTARVTAWYQQQLGRPLAFRPLVMASVMDTRLKGLSLKGGAIARQVVYRMEGEQLLRDSPKARAMLMHLVAHELAHIWQTNVRRGGIGEGAAWVHEGGAEALALAALRGTGLVSAGEAEQKSREWIEQCAKLNGQLEAYPGAYACGFHRYAESGQDVARLWSAMISLTETSGRPYDPAMFDAAVAQLRAAAH